MDIEVRTARDGDREVMHRLGQQAFMATPAPYEEDVDRSGAPLERRLVAVEGKHSTVVGRWVTWELGQWYGGRLVPMGGVAGVAIDPAYRSRGVGSALLRASLPMMRERGEALSTLYPMNHRFYRKHGWELAGVRPAQQAPMQLVLDLPRPDRAVRVRTAVEDDLPALRALRERALASNPGNLWHGEVFAAQRMLPYKDLTEAYVAELGDTITGLLVFGHIERVDSAEMYALAIRQLIAEDLDSELALWQLIAGHYPAARTVEFVLPHNATILTALGERGTRTSDGAWCWMSRLVDAAAAVAARGFRPDVDVEISLDIADEHAPWNHGPHVLRVKDGQGSLEPGGTGAVQIGVGRLSSLYTGWAEPAHLAVLGLLRGAHNDDLVALDAAFCGRTPWMAEFF